MTYKVQKIRKEVEIIVNRRLNLLNGDYFDLNKEVNGFTNEIMDIIDSLQEKPVSKEIGDYDHKAVMEALHPELKEESVSEDLEIEIKHCIYEPFFDLDGVAIKGATKYLTVEDIADIARYFANWQKKQDQETIELAEDHAMFAGMNKMEQQMKAKAIDAHCFGFQGAALFSFRLPADNYLVGSVVKVIVIKED